MILKCVLKLNTMYYKLGWSVLAMIFEDAESDENLNFSIKGQGHLKNKMADMTIYGMRESPKFRQLLSSVR